MVKKALEFFNASDEEAVKDKEKDLKNDRLQQLEDIKYILNTDAGKRFFQRFFEDGHVFRTSMTGNSYTYFQEGERNLALRYFGDIVEVCPEKVTELIIKEK
jgi:hypothetical protein